MVFVINLINCMPPPIGDGADEKPLSDAKLRITIQHAFLTVWNNIQELTNNDNGGKPVYL